VLSQRVSPASLLAGVGVLLAGCGTEMAEERSIPRPFLEAPAESSVDAGHPFSAVLREGEGAIKVLYVPSAGWAERGVGDSLTGITVEIVRAFAAWVEASESVRLDIEWEAEEDWSRFYRRVRGARDGVLGLGNVTITEARREELDFSPPYLNNVAVLFTHEDVAELGSMDEATEALAGFTAYPYRGTLHEERVNQLREQRIPGLRVIPQDSNDAILEAVAEGPGRLAWIDGYAFWRGLEAGLPLRRHPVGDDGSETFGIILPRGSEWTPMIGRFLREDGGFRDTPDYRALLERFLGEGLVEILEDARRRAEAGSATSTPR
jgi:ABC-type amino acid transport substrate-binding protein